MTSPLADPHSDPRGFLTGLFHIAVEKADPMKSVSAHLPERPDGRLFVIGAGKASARMAEAVEATYGPCEGFVITRYGYARPCEGIEIVEAAHPVPDQAGLEATQELLSRVQDLKAEDTVIALISGGGSALLCAPTAGITLEEKQALNQALLSSGAPISEMNAVRGQFSDVKAGQLAAACHPAKVVSLLISDVPGDNPAEIASGPTVPSESTPLKALEVIRKWDIPLPQKMQAILDERAKISTFPTIETTPDEIHIVAAPSQSLKAAAEAAQRLGCKVEILGDALEGEARDLAAEQVKLAIFEQSKMTPGDAPLLLLSGGECTVTRRGNGVGGPNAEFTLAALLALKDQKGIHVMACDTDGVDGAAEVAGAYAWPQLVEEFETAKSALAANDAHSYFEKQGTQVVTGPTLTNVNDFRAILIFPPD